MLAPVDGETDGQVQASKRQRVEPPPQGGTTVPNGKSVLSTKAIRSVLKGRLPWLFSSRVPALLCSTAPGVQCLWCRQSPTMHRCVTRDRLHQLAQRLC